MDSFWFIVLAVGAGWGAILLFKANQDRKAQERLNYVLTRTVAQHINTLTRRRDQTVVQGAYGEWIFSDWEREVKHFYNNVMEPALFAEYRSADEQYVIATNKKMYYGLCFEAVDRACVHAQNMPKKTNSLWGQGFAEMDDDLHLSDPLAFERWCAQRLQDNGWQARTTKGSGDQGVDVFAEKNGTRVVLQCKLYSGAVGNKAVQEAHAAKVFESADYAAVVTNQSYTKSARALAQRTGVQLLHMDDLYSFSEVA